MWLLNRAGIKVKEAEMDSKFNQDKTKVHILIWYGEKHKKVWRHICGEIGPAWCNIHYSRRNGRKYVGQDSSQTSQLRKGHHS